MIETYLTTEDLASNQSLVALDDQGKRWDVSEVLTSSYASRTDKGRAPQEHEVILERWTIQLGEDGSRLPTDLTNILPLVYKKSIVLFRSLFTYSNFLPAWKFSKALGKVRSQGALKLRYRIMDGSQMGLQGLQDNLTVPLFESKDKVVEDYAFGITDSPAGPFSVGVTYRTACDFRVDDSEALLSSRFLGTDDEIFAPSLLNKDPTDRPRTKPIHEVGSLPSQTRHQVQEPDLGHAYGSLSTFHQVGPASGSSPISVLRNANDLFSDIPTSSPSTRPAPLQRSPQSSRPTLRTVEGATGNARRPSLSFQPFKTPSLSASPAMMSPLAGSPRTSLARAPVLASLNEARGIASPVYPSSTAPKQGAKLPDNAMTSSASSSPKPAPITRYSSSFSHRRGRLSSGGTTKTDEDQTSSGKGSATSSAQPGSGLLAEVGGGSSGSVHDDDENISDFLKMLDLKKDLLTPSDAASTEASTRRTTAALTRFHRMRDSNKELSDSMSSSLLLRAGSSSDSSSRQLSSVPPMIPPTSVSTSSSPGKPLSPHTPHTPAIPSRLSAASNIDYSHQDLGTQHDRLSNEQHDSPPDAGLIEEPALEPSGSNVNAIPIPTSPRPFLPAYRRSSSAAQRRTSPDVDDIADLYGVRPASMGAGDRQPRSRMPAAIAQDDSEARDMPADFPVDSVDNRISDRPEISPRRSSLKAITSMLPSTDGAGSGSASGNSFTHNVYRSRLSRGGRGRGTPPHGSSSSFGGGTVDGGSTISDRRGRPPSFSRPESKYEEDEPFLFTMSDIGASRRSLEETQGGPNFTRMADKNGEADAGKRGNKRGGGAAGFGAWA
jgi:autophagy-related protein 13